jgi:hypothetical protein
MWQNWGKASSLNRALKTIGKRELARRRWSRFKT